MDNYEFAVFLRCELKKQAEGLKLQREAILAQVALLERTYNISDKIKEKENGRTGKITKSPDAAN